MDRARPTPAPARKRVLTVHERWSVVRMVDVLSRELSAPRQQAPSKSEIVRIVAECLGTSATTVRGVYGSFAAPLEPSRAGRSRPRRTNGAFVAIRLELRRLAFASPPLTLAVARSVLAAGLGCAADDLDVVDVDEALRGLRASVSGPTGFIEDLDVVARRVAYCRMLVAPSPQHAIVYAAAWYCHVKLPTGASDARGRSGARVR